MAGAARRGGRDEAERRALTRALRALLDEDEAAAEEALAEVARSDPMDQEAYLALGALFRRRGETGRAIRIHQHLLVRGEHSRARRAELLGALADDLRAGGFRDRAIEGYEEVLSLASRDADALKSLFELRVEGGEAEQAIEIEKRLARAESGVSAKSRAQRLVTVGRVAQQASNDDLARKAVKRALRSDSECAEAQLLMAELETSRGRARQAHKAWCRVAELEGQPSLGRLQQIGESFDARGKADDFDPWLRKRAEGGDLAARRLLATRLGSAGEVDVAASLLRDGIAANPGQLDLHVALCRLLQESDRKDELASATKGLLDTIEAGPPAALSAPEGEAPAEDA